MLSPRVSCWANKCLPERLGGTAQHAKVFKTNSVTGLEMLSSQHWFIGLQNIIFAPFSLGFSRKIGCGPFGWAGNHCVVPPGELLDKQMSPTKAVRSARRAKAFKTNSVTSLEMLYSQHWSLKLHNVIFAPFSRVFFFLSEKWVAVPSVGPGTIVSFPG